MVVSRSDSKRRRREGDVATVTIIQEDIPKRAKVHAQRKFAQGSASLSAPSLLPVKDKAKNNESVLPPKFIPSNRPKTEDFLTFLCFRGTSTLPPRLDFFNVASLQESLENNCESSVAVNNRSGSTVTVNNGGNRQRTSERNRLGFTSVPNSVPIKRHDVDTKKKGGVAVQALRKKYQDQRLEKQRVNSLSKLAQKVKGKNMVRTRSSGNYEENTIEKQTIGHKKEVVKKKHVKRISCPIKRLLVKRRGLRSGGLLPITRQTKVAVAVTVKKVNKPFKSSLSDFSSDDDQPLLKKPRIVDSSKHGRKMAQKVKKRYTQPKRLKPQIMTRSRLKDQRVVRPIEAKVKEAKKVVSNRPTRKTKEAATFYMEMLGKRLIDLGDEEDDLLSLDSFPELPNAKRNEQREKEIKAKAKEKDVVTKTKAKPKLSIGRIKLGEDKVKTRTSAVKTKLSPSESFSDSDEEPLGKLALRKQSIVNVGPNVTRGIKEALRESVTHVPLPTKKVIKKEKCMDKVLPVVKDVIEVEKKEGKVNMSTVEIEKWLAESSNQADSKTKPSDAQCNKLTMRTRRENVNNSMQRPFRESLSRAIAESIKDNANLIRKRFAEEQSKEVSPVSNVTPFSSVDESLTSAGLERTPEKKSIFQRSKQKKEQQSVSDKKPNTNAFSPENESSVYAFDNEMEQPKPLRWQASRSEEDVSKLGDHEIVQSQNYLTLEKQTVKKKDELNISNTTSNSDEDLAQVRERLRTSIAVQVNLDTDKVPPLLEETDNTQLISQSLECSTQTEEDEDDNTGHLFYIPLQPGAAGSQGMQAGGMIQGVAVKLGTEGPTGPNQRVIMRAKLVTKPPTEHVNRTLPSLQQPRCPVNGFPSSRSSLQASTENAVKWALPRSMNIKRKEATNYYLQTPDKIVVAKKEAFISVVPPLAPLSYAPKKVPSPVNMPGPSKGAKRGSKRPTCIVTNPNPTRIQPKSNPTAFPSPGLAAGQLVEAPTFYPTEKEFQDPIEFIDRIRPIAEKFGICRVVPPAKFKPECKVSDDMRFTAYNQYVHKTMHRWGPNVKEMMAIRKYLATQNIVLKQPPYIGSVEIDLPRLYQTVQGLGGLKEVILKARWHRVADEMKISKSAQDRATKLDDIYCKYLLPYETLSTSERARLLDDVEKSWNQRNSEEMTTCEDAWEDDNDECIIKGRNMALNQFYRTARNTMNMWFKRSEPKAEEVETEFWKHVTCRQCHVCVHSGSIESSRWGYGFPVSKNSPCAKHGWNLKVLTNNNGSVLRSIGPIMGVTVPTLHVGMLFTTCCWYRDPHGLPWIEYLHTGAKKIWYGIPDNYSSEFRAALTKLVPRYVKNKTIWLPSDTAMVPPPLLVEHGVSLSHIVQEPGQFIIVFPRAFTSSICTGYLVSESVYFAQPSWLSTAEQVFKDIQDSCEPSMFSLERLLFSISLDSRSSIHVLKQVLPMIGRIRERELDYRRQLSALGLKATDRLKLPEANSKKRKSAMIQDEGDYECEICRANLYVSLVTNSHEEGVYCLAHAVDLLTRQFHQLKFCTLLYTYNQPELDNLVEKLEDRIQAKSQRKPHSKPSS